MRSLQAGVPRRQNKRTQMTEGRGVAVTLAPRAFLTLTVGIRCCASPRFAASPASAAALAGPVTTAVGGSGASAARFAAADQAVPRAANAHHVAYPRMQFSPLRSIQWHAA